MSRTSGPYHIYKRNPALFVPVRGMEDKLAGLSAAAILPLYGMRVAAFDMHALLLVIPTRIGVAPLLSGVILACFR
jgi:hypothetical protein